VTLESGSPSPERDRQKSHANSTAGRIAEASGAKGKEPVNLISGSPAPERDLQKMHANSSNGKIAEASGASRYVVEELAALQKANPEAFAAVASGEARLKDRRHIHSAGLSKVIDRTFQA